MTVIEDDFNERDLGDDEEVEYGERNMQEQWNKDVILRNWMSEDEQKYHSIRHAMEVSQMEDKVALKYPQYQLTNIKGGRDTSIANAAGIS